MSVKLHLFLIHIFVVTSTRHMRRLANKYRTALSYENINHLDDLTLSLSLSLLASPTEVPYAIITIIQSITAGGHAGSYGNRERLTKIEFPVYRRLA